MRLRFLLFCRVEDEAVLDRGAAFVKHVCDEEEVEGGTTFQLISVSPHSRRNTLHFPSF